MTISLTCNVAPLLGLLLYRQGAPAPESFAFLRAAGFDVATAGPVRRGWALDLRHAALGTVRLEHDPARRLPLREALQLAPGLLPHEREEIGGVRSVILVTGGPADVPDPFVARKRFLRLLGAVLGPHGFGALDLLAMRAWTRAALDDELAHEEGADVEMLHVLHSIAVSDPRRLGRSRVAWLHSHGLASLGAFDFDVLLPSAGVVTCRELWRALALEVIAGVHEAGGPAHEVIAPRGRVQFVETDRFLALAPRRFVEEWELMLDPLHVAGHAVACEPSDDEERVRPARFFSRRLPRDLAIILSPASAERMAARARATWDSFAAAVEEVGGEAAPALVKAAWPLGDGRREHLWFEVEAVRGREADVRLLTVPWDARELTRGQRGTFSAEALTDWVVPTPFGDVTPSWQGPLRRLRRARAGDEPAPPQTGEGGASFSTGESASSTRPRCAGVKRASRR